MEVLDDSKFKFAEIMNQCKTLSSLMKAIPKSMEYHLEKHIFDFLKSHSEYNDSEIFNKIANAVKCRKDNSYEGMKLKHPNLIKVIQKADCTFEDKSDEVKVKIIDNVHRQIKLFADELKCQLRTLVKDEEKETLRERIMDNIGLYIVNLIPNYDYFNFMTDETTDDFPSGLEAYAAYLMDREL